MGEDDFLIVDKCDAVPKNLHNGVHYLHSIPSLPFDMEFKSVTLTDGVLDAETPVIGTDGKIDGKTEIRHIPNLQDMLKYSEKVREVQHPSSIMEIGKRESVFLPKTNTLNEMIVRMESYIGSKKFMMGYQLHELNVEEKYADVIDAQKGIIRIHYKNCISTLSLGLVQEHFGEEYELKANPVYICNAVVDKIVPNWMINLYVPNSNTPMYRASLLNNVVSIESIHEMSREEVDTAFDVLRMFHIDRDSSEVYTWNTGKVMSISIDQREGIITKMAKKNFYSIGRFGLWNRKLLVDSTIGQAESVVKFLLNKESWEDVKSKLSK